LGSFSATVGSWATRVDGAAVFRESAQELVSQLDQHLADEQPQAPGYNRTGFIRASPSAHYVHIERILPLMSTDVRGRAALSFWNDWLVQAVASKWVSRCCAMKRLREA
jgi:hypothetical protein